MNNNDCISRESLTLLTEEEPKPKVGFVLPV